MAKSSDTTNDVAREELKQIMTIFLDLPKTDRAILLNTAMAFKTLRKIENQPSEVSKNM